MSPDRPWHRFWPGHVPPALSYPRVPAWWILERNLSHHAGRVAIRQIDPQTGQERCTLTYEDLFERAEGLASGLCSWGVEKGDRIAICLPNSPELIVSLFGVWLAGGVAVLGNAASRANELAYQITDSGARLLICTASTLQVARQAIASQKAYLIVASPDGSFSTPSSVLRPPSFVVRPSSSVLRPSSSVLRPSSFVLRPPIDPEEDLALLLYTGGTTGVPKGAMLTHFNLVANTLQFATWYAFAEGDEVCISALPLSHSGGLSGALSVPLSCGGTLLLMERFNGRTVIDCVERYRATRFFGVPTMYIAVLNDPGCASQDLSSLRACRTNAAPLPVSVKHAFDRRVGREVLVEGYGLTETSPLAIANPIGRAKAGSIGIPLSDTEAAIVDAQSGTVVSPGSTGELVLRGPQVMKGYWGRPEATAEAMAGGWFHSGDIARMDEDGYFTIIDRKKDVINTGGFKVWPREVEEVLYTHPAVKLAAVIGVPDDYWGEAVKACVVLKEGQPASVTADEIRAFCKERLAAYKAPKTVEFRAELPISANGKLLRRLLRDER